MKAVKIEWVDSHGFGGWKSKSDAMEFASLFPLRCLSVGLVYYEDEVAVTLCTSFSEDQVGDLLKIPKTAIIEMAVIADEITPPERKERGNAEQ